MLAVIGTIPAFGHYQRAAIRVAAWTTGRPVPHPTARVVSGWEPVIYVPARRSRSGGPPTTDVLIGKTTRQRPTLPTAVIGMKSPEFCVWMFGLIGAEPGDSLDDLFPGSGIVGRSWRAWSGADEPPELGLVDELQPHELGFQG